MFLTCHGLKKAKKWFIVTEKPEGGGVVFRYTMQDRIHGEGFQERASGREEGLSKVAMAKGFGVKSRNLMEEDISKLEFND